jgi:predicted phosphodiesterase
MERTTDKVHQKMKLQIMSDLHLEMHADRGAELIRELDPTGVDVLVLAGDITSARYYEDLENVFKPLARKYRHMLYVPGNHEYYKSSPKQVTRNLAKLVKEVPEVVIPDNGAVLIAGQRFIGGTMWFRPDPMGELNKRFMHDFSLIQDFEPWVYDQNIAFEKALATEVEAGDVVVSHHLPAPESVPPRFAGSAINAFFVSDMTSYLRELQPKLWIHGHTHDRCDYVIDKTRVVANPLGYPNEFRSLEAFEPAFHVVI